MDVSEGNQNDNDLLVFARKNKAKAIDLVENKIRKLISAKLSFELEIEFSIVKGKQ